MDNKVRCACCGKLTIDKNSLFEVCSNCNWEKDRVQEEKPNYKGGANKMSLNEAKEAYKKGLPIE